MLKYVEKWSHRPFEQAAYFDLQFIFIIKCYLVATCKNHPSYWTTGGRNMSIPRIVLWDWEGWGGKGYWDKTHWLRVGNVKFGIALKMWCTAVESILSVIHLSPEAGGCFGWGVFAFQLFLFFFGCSLWYDQISILMTFEIWSHSQSMLTLLSHPKTLEISRHAGVYISRGFEVSGVKGETFSTASVIIFTFFWGKPLRR